jgi:hypothetical protein
VVQRVQIWDHVLEHAPLLVEVALASADPVGAVDFGSVESGSGRVVCGRCRAGDRRVPLKLVVSCGYQLGEG